MKVINVGLSILISMGLAVSPIHANEIDSTDETNEVGVVNQEETTVDNESNVESQADEKKVTSIRVMTDERVHDYILDENETINIKLIVYKNYDDGTSEETTDYTYYINNYYGGKLNTNLSLSNRSGQIKADEIQSGSDNEISVTKTSKGFGYFSVHVHADGMDTSNGFDFNSSHYVNVTLDSKEGHFKDGSTTFNLQSEKDRYFDIPDVIAPDGYKLIGWFDKDGVALSDHELSEDTTFYAKYAKEITITYDYNGGENRLGSSYKETIYEGQSGNDLRFLGYTPEIKGKRFTGWHLDSVDGPLLNGANTIFDKDTVLVAAYADIISVTINFDGLDKEPSSIDVTSGENIYLPMYLDRFIPDEKEVIEIIDNNTNKHISYHSNVTFNESTNITVVVKDKIKLILDSNGAGYEQQVKYMSRSGGQISNVFTEAPEGKYFYGWAVGSVDGPIWQNYVDTPEVGSCVTLYAIWKDGYKVTLDMGNDAEGSLWNSLTMAQGNIFEKNSEFSFYNVSVNKRPEGKILVGYRVNDNPKVLDTNSSFVLCQDTTLHAVWEDAITVMVRRPDTNDEIYRKEIAKGSSFNDTYEVNYRLHEGEIIKGWTLDKDSKEPVDLSKVKFDKDVTLYPIIAKGIKLTLDWGNDGGSGSFGGYNSNTVYNTQGSYSVNVNSSPKGKVLIGWQVDGTNKVFTMNYDSIDLNDYQFEKDTTLHAVWQDAINVVFDANGETFIGNEKQIKCDVVKNKFYDNINMPSNYTDALYNADRTKVVVGWRVNSKDGPLLENTSKYSFDSDATYYAQWEDEQTYSFEHKGYVVRTFTNSCESKTLMSDIINRPESFITFDENEGFLGWFNKETGEKITNVSQLTKSCVIEAKTVKKSPTITFDYNGGKGGLTQIQTKGGFVKYQTLKDPFMEVPTNKVFVGWSLTRDGDVIQFDDNSYHFDADATLYAKYADTITLTIHEDDTTRKEKVAKDEWLSIVPMGSCVIDGKTYYPGQRVKFTKDTDVYVEKRNESSSVYVSHKDLSYEYSFGFGGTADSIVSTDHHMMYVVSVPAGKIANLELDKSFIPEGMEFDHWVSIPNVEIKDPTSMKTTFVMPDGANGSYTYIYPTYRKAVPIQFKKESVELTKGERSQLKVNGDYETLTWSSSDPTTVQVDQSGNIHAVKSGKATIRVTDQKGKRIECVVTVTNKLKSLALSENQLELKGKTDKKLSVALTPGDADDVKLTWSSSDDKVVKVSNDGTVTTVSCGEATITVKSESGLTDSCKVTVKHDYVFKSKTEPTLEKEGKIVYECSLCKKTKEETIPKITADWVTDENGKMYKYSDGTFEKSGFKKIQGKTYYFQNNGYVKTGKLVLDQDTYMFDSEGVMITGCYGDYYFGEDGKMKTNAFVDGYYLGADGKCVKNQWIKVDGKDYFMDANGKAKKNAWQGAYYLGENGAMLTNAFTPDGYYVGADGAYYTNRWFKDQGKEYYVNGSGKLVKNSWQGAYYLGEDGAMLTNAFTPDGYYVGNDGAYYTNRWFKDQGKDYYVNGFGKVVKNAWQGAYYLGKDGVMLTNAFTPDGFYVGTNGAYVTNQKVTVEGKDYYLNADGKLAKNQWVGDYYLDGNGNVTKNQWAGSYWCGEDGKYVKSSWVDNNKSYVGANGVYVTNQWIGDYYLNGSGVKVINAWVGSYWCGSDGKYVKSSWVDNNKYYVGANGIYVTNQWVEDHYLNGAGLVTRNAWVGDYYLNGNGDIAKNTWAGSYWCGEDGKYVRSAWVDNNKSYVNQNGVYVTNQWIGDYYLNGSGVKVSNAWAGSYWCGEDGKYVRSAWVDNNKSYVNQYGNYVTNQWIGDYYLNGSGVKVTNAWVGSYWCGSDGKYVRSSWVDNNRYYVNENGIYVAGAWEKDSKGWKYHAGNVYAKDITLNINGTSYTFDSNGYMK